VLRIHAQHLLPFRFGLFQLPTRVEGGPQCQPGRNVSGRVLDGDAELGHRTFDVDTLTYALFLVIIGAHISVFAVSAKVFGTQEGFLPKSPRYERIFQYITLETGLVFGCFLLLVGVGLLGYAIHLWRLAGFGNLSPQHMLRLTLPSATCLMLGVEAIFGSFFLSLLGMKRR